MSTHAHLEKNLISMHYLFCQALHHRIASTARLCHYGVDPVDLHIYIHTYLQYICTQNGFAIPVHIYNMMFIFGLVYDQHVSNIHCYKLMPQSDADLFGMQIDIFKDVLMHTD